MRKTIIDSPTSPTCAFERCTTPARDNGWCATHEYARELLRTAREYGCPRLEVVTTYTRYDMATRKEVTEQFVWIVGRGYDGWMAVCERVTQEHARKIGAVLEREYSGMFGKKGEVA